MTMTTRHLTARRVHWSHGLEALDHYESAGTWLMLILITLTATILLGAWFLIAQPPAWAPNAAVVGLLGSALALAAALVTGARVDALHKAHLGLHDRWCDGPGSHHPRFRYDHLWSERA